MDPHIKSKSGAGNRVIRYLYLFTIFFLALSGFGQMPIFKRYYIADIPGLEWLAQFYTTHYIHYLGAIVILALGAYLCVDFLLRKKANIRLTTSGYIRSTIIFGLAVSGVILVFRNLTGTQFSSAFIIAMDLGHLALVMALLMVSGFCLITRKRWVMHR
jgi:hypothetical protein